MKFNLNKSQNIAQGPRGYVRNPGLGIGVLFGSFFILLFIVSMVAALLQGDDVTSTRFMRIATVAQDLFVFIVPALIAAIAVTRLPATFLCLDVKPRLRHTLFACLILVASIPAMDWIVYLNQSVHFPESLSGIEETLRKMESDADSAVYGLFGNYSVGDIIMSILIVGVLTGLAEELFFRGALQNLFASARMKKHLAVWLAAVIFSFMHFQFFGFIPRVLLGAYFGYLLWWTGSVWAPIIVHALNNSLVVAVTSLGLYADSENGGTAVNNVMEADTMTVVLSFVVTALGIYILHRQWKTSQRVDQMRSNSL